MSAATAMAEDVVVGVAIPPKSEEAPTMEPQP